MIIAQEYTKIIFDIQSEFPGFELIEKKNSSLMKVINFVLKLITFGKMKTFMTNFVTTIGKKIYLPLEWENYSLDIKMEILRHERIHLRQTKKYGNFLFSVLYLFFPFPIGMAYFRKKFEQEAYEESLRTIYQIHGKNALKSVHLKERIISFFIDHHYFWMWPFRKSLDVWYDEVVERILSGN